MIVAVLPVQPLVPSFMDTAIVSIAGAASADEEADEGIEYDLDDQFDHIEYPDEITDHAVEGTVDGIDAISGEIDFDLETGEELQGDDLIYPTEGDDAGAGTAEGAAWVPLIIVIVGLIVAAAVSFILASKKAKAIKEAQLAADPAAQMADPAAQMAVDPMMVDPAAQAAIPPAPGAPQPVVDPAVQQQPPQPPVPPAPPQ